MSSSPKFGRNREKNGKGRKEKRRAKGEERKERVIFKHSAIFSLLLLDFFLLYFSII